MSRITDQQAKDRIKGVLAISHVTSNLIESLIKAYGLEAVQEVVKTDFAHLKNALQAYLDV